MQQASKTSKRSVKHDTIRLERHVKAPPQRVFEAWTDPDARRAWVGPVKSCEHIDERTDFRVRGTEVVRSGPQGDPHYKAEIHDLHNRARAARRADLVLADHHRVPSRRRGNKLVFTEQASFLDGKDTKKDRKAAWERNLDQLDSYLSDERSDER